MESLSEQMRPTTDFVFKEWVSTWHAFVCIFVKYGV